MCTVVSPAGEKPALAVPAKHWPRAVTEGTSAMDPVHWVGTDSEAAAGDGVQKGVYD